MPVLVSASSKHGATAEIAEAIAAAIRRSGVAAVALAPDRVGDLAEYDGFVFGSAVYAGRWMAPIRDLLETHADELRSKPVWLFSSGPLGDPPQPEEGPVDVAGLIDATGARQHRVFPGRLEKVRLRFGERAIVAALRAPEGDFRAWGEIEQWATEIAEVMAEANRSTGGRG